jgi:hypothetical protein
MTVSYTGNEAYITLDIAGESHAERLLLAHLQEDHLAVLCQGPFGGNGVRVHVRSKKSCDFVKEIEDHLDRKGRLERRRHPQAKARRGR